MFFTVAAVREAQARQRAASIREAQARQRAASIREAQARQRAASINARRRYRTTRLRAVIDRPYNETTVLICFVLWMGLLFTCCGLLLEAQGTSGGDIAVVVNADVPIGNLSF